jgi:hypothetical protein
MRAMELCSIPGRSKKFSLLYCVHDSSGTSFFFLGWGEAESTWYIGQYLAYCTYIAPMVWSSRVESELAVETEGLGGHLLQCHFVHHKSRMT